MRYQIIRLEYETYIMVPVYVPVVILIIRGAFAVDDDLAFGGMIEPAYYVIT